jgi:ornithine decarboxylase
MTIYTTGIGIQNKYLYNSNKRWIYDKLSLLKQINNWSTNIPWIKPFYAMKSNPSLSILKTLLSHNFKIGFDVASQKELKTALKLTNVNNIIYTNPFSIPHERLHTMSQQPMLKVIDTISELYTIIKYNIKHHILIRVVSGITSANCNFDLKFGATIKEAMQIILEARKHSVLIKGISFHIGSGGEFSRSDSYKKSYNTVIPLLEMIMDNKEKFIIDDKEQPILNFGGGLLSNTNLEEALGWTKKLPYNMIAEPGRYFSEPSYHLYVQVIGKTRRGIYLDNGVYHELNVFHRDYWKFPNLSYVINDNIDKVSSYDEIMVFGPTCDNYDTLGICKLPKDLKVGDWIFLPNMGAYTKSGMVEFNGIKGASSKGASFKGTM